MVCIPDFMAVLYSAVMASSDKFQNPCPPYSQSCALLGVDQDPASVEDVILNPEIHVFSDNDVEQDGDEPMLVSDDNDEELRANDPAASVTFDYIFCISD